MAPKAKAHALALQQPVETESRKWLTYHGFCELHLSRGVNRADIDVAWRFLDWAGHHRMVHEETGDLMLLVEVSSSITISTTD